ncbi:hypothetical protein SBA2_240034 [Acidobacteriia bacterium SbA2]|nr:hypothetical protein SBA2_240034 [Acidobacteriia bacterium SbA2]
MNWWSSEIHEPRMTRSCLESGILKFFFWCTRTIGGFVGIEFVKECRINIQPEHAYRICCPRLGCPGQREI